MIFFFYIGTWSSKKNPAKFSDTCSVRADRLCIGSPRLVGGRKAVNSNMQEFFCATLYTIFFALKKFSKPSGNICHPAGIS